MCCNLPSCLAAVIFLNGNLVRVQNVPRGRAAYLRAARVSPSTAPWKGTCWGREALKIKALLGGRERYVPWKKTWFCHTMSATKCFCESTIFLQFGGKGRRKVIEYTSRWYLRCVFLTACSTWAASGAPVSNSWNLSETFCSSVSLVVHLAFSPSVLCHLCWFVLFLKTTAEVPVCFWRLPHDGNVGSLQGSS